MGDNTAVYTQLPSGDAIFHAMKRLIKLFIQLHITLYRLTRGKIGGNLAGNRILLLSSVGRRTGQQYISPIVFVPHHETYLVIASNNGGPNHPGWYYNLQAHPATTVEIGGQQIPVMARLAQTEERAELWPMIVAQHPQFARYQAKTSRQIGVFILTPMGG